MEYSIKLWLKGKKPDTKENILYDSTYKGSQTRKRTNYDIRN